MLAPTLRTSRLTLRVMEADDWPAFRDFMAGPRARYMGGPFDRDTAWGMFASDAAHWNFYGHGGLMIEAAGETVGQVAVLKPPSFPDVELGWFLYDGQESRGYATEAAAELRDWYYAEHPAPARLVSYVDPKNTASARVARRLGAELTPGLPAPHTEDDVYLYAPPGTIQ